MTDPTSRQRGRERTTHTVKVRPETTSGHESQTGLDTKTDWLTDRQSQRDFDFDMPGLRMFTGELVFRSDFSLTGGTDGRLRATGEARASDCLLYGTGLSKGPSRQAVLGVRLTEEQVLNTGFSLRIYLLSTSDLMSGEEELAFLMAHLGELSQAVLRQLKRDKVAEKKRREAEDAAKAKGSGERPTGQPSGRHPGSAGGETSVSQKATAGKRKANELDSSDSGVSMEPANRRPAPGPLSGAGSAPLPHRQREAPPKAR
jgi:hypothetical protein